MVGRPFSPFKKKFLNGQKINKDFRGVSILNNHRSIKVSQAEINLFIAVVKLPDLMSHGSLRDKMFKLELYHFNLSKNSFSRRKDGEKTDRSLTLFFSTCTKIGKFPNWKKKKALPVSFISAFSQNKNLLSESQFIKKKVVFYDFISRLHFPSASFDSRFSIFYIQMS